LYLFFLSVDHTFYSYEKNVFSEYNAKLNCSLMMMELEINIDAYYDFLCVKSLFFASCDSFEWIFILDIKWPLQVLSTCRTNKSASQARWLWAVAVCTWTNEQHLSTHWRLEELVSEWYSVSCTVWNYVDYREEFGRLSLNAKHFWFWF
jgi:hypothetical protein